LCSHGVCSKKLFGRCSSARGEANGDILSLFPTKAHAVPAKQELDGIPERRSADELDNRAAAETHLQQATAQLAIAADAQDRPAAAGRQAIQATGLRAEAPQGWRELT
jgi:hypothetical protein